VERLIHVYLLLITCLRRQIHDTSANREVGPQPTRVGYRKIDKNMLLRPLYAQDLEYESMLSA